MSPSASRLRGVDEHPAIYETTRPFRSHEKDRIVRSMRLVKATTTSAFIREADAQQVVGSPPEVVLYIDGSKCATSDSLMQEWARGLRFPDYFGHNWDAFEECVNDIHEWLETSNVLIVVRDANMLLVSDTNRRQNVDVLLEILHSATGCYVDEPARVDLSHAIVLFLTKPDHRKEFDDLVRSTQYDTLLKPVTLTNDR